MITGYNEIVKIFEAAYQNDSAKAIKYAQRFINKYSLVEPELSKAFKSIMEGKINTSEVNLN